MRRSHHIDLRGSTRDRRARRQWMLTTFGNGKVLACHHCGRRMRTTFEVDRWPVCGHKGGRYVHGNIVPSCRRCNRGHKCNRSKPTNNGEVT